MSTDRMKNEKISSQCGINPETWLDYVDNDIDPSLRKDLSLHLQECEICQSHFAEFRWVNRILKNSEEETKIPDDKFFKSLESKIMNSLDVPAEVERKGNVVFPFQFRRLAVPVAAAASLVLMVLGSLYTTSSFKTSTNFANNRNGNIEEQMLEQTAETDPESISGSMMTTQDEDDLVLDAAAAKLSRMSDTEARTMLDNMK